MYKLFTFLTCLGFLSFSQKSINPLPIGADMPMKNINLKDISGKEISLSGAAGNKGLLVVFSCNTCPYVIKNEERISELPDLAAKLGIGMIIINSNEANRENGESFIDMQAYAKDKKITCHYAIDTDSKLADAFGANRTPECFLFDQTQKLAYHGAIDDSPTDAASVKRKHLYEAMMEISSGKTASVQETKSIGCTIKRKAKN